MPCHAMPFELFTLIIPVLRINSSNIHNPCFPTNYVGGIIRHDLALGREAHVCM